MLTWLMSNLATMVVCLILAAILGWIISTMVKNKKKGKSSCGCGCSGCAMSGMCHPKKDG